ncbi:GGDEF domain-containing protein [Gayadomonas joobiniege]|uniref:GGDEF domain-containing protein n=1 Tax=Gayadomonas joobiniege TaxID=1234606 RepID=UPI0003726306|nr:GGDEF domain-containing protein [Gayadomonas joobiniege]
MSDLVLSSLQSHSKSAQSFTLVGSHATEIFSNVQDLASKVLPHIQLSIYVPHQGKLWHKESVSDEFKAQPLVQLPSYYQAMKSRLKHQPMCLNAADLSREKSCSFQCLMFPFKVADLNQIGAIVICCGNVQARLEPYVEDLIWSLVRTLELGLRSVRIESLQHENKKLSVMATNDELTKLPNRVAFTAEFKQKLALADRRQDNCAMLMIDLNDFKLINDQYGHLVGDQILYLVARRLNSLVRDSDFCARLGGDEFVVLTSTINKAQVAVLADRIASAFKTEFTLEGVAYRVGVSIGISLFPLQGREQSEVLACTDSAMYHAKKLGLGFHFYAAEAK